MRKSSTQPFNFDEMKLLVALTAIYVVTCVFGQVTKPAHWMEGKHGKNTLFAFVLYNLYLFFFRSLS